MSDDLMRPIYEMQQNHRANRGAAEEIDAIDQVVNHIEAQADEITRLRAALATARREGMEAAVSEAQARAKFWVSGNNEEAKIRYDEARKIAVAIRAAAKEDREP